MDKIHVEIMLMPLIANHARGFHIIATLLFKYNYDMSLVKVISSIYALIEVNILIFHERITTELHEIILRNFQ